MAKKIRKIGIVLGITGGIISLSALPVQAFLSEALKGLSTITALVQQKDLIKSQFTNPQNLFFFNEDEQGNSVSLDGSGNISIRNTEGESISVNLGEGGLPDLKELMAQVVKFATDSQQYDEADEASHHAVREVTKAKAEGTLSEEGQQAVSERLDAATETAEATQQLGEDAQTESVTQNVLKKIAQQNTHLATLIAINLIPY